MAKKAIFFDRDDTLIEDPGYINTPDQVKLLDGVAEALIELKQMGYKLVVVSNQSGVARGIVTEQVLGEIHRRLQQLLAENRASIDRIYYCPFHPEGVIKKYRKESKHRKPSPGMLLTAASEMNIGLDQSWMIGNSDRDIKAGSAAGCKTILIDTPAHEKRFEDHESNPDYKVVNMKEAVNVIKKHLRASGKTETPDESASTEQSDKQATSKSEQQDKPADNEESADNRTEELLNRILAQLKIMQRDYMFGEFSVMRMMAGIVQIAASFCLVITIWFLLSPAKETSSVFIALGFSIVFQLMALTFYMMQGRQ